MMSLVTIRGRDTVKVHPIANWAPVHHGDGGLPGCALRFASRQHDRGQQQRVSAEVQRLSALRRGRRTVEAADAKKVRRLWRSFLNARRDRKHLVVEPLRDKPSLHLPDDRLHHLDARLGRSS